MAWFGDGGTPFGTQGDDGEIRGLALAALQTLLRPQTSRRRLDVSWTVEQTVVLAVAAVKTLQVGASASGPQKVYTTDSYRGIQRKRKARGKLMRRGWALTVLCLTAIIVQLSIYYSLRAMWRAWPGPREQTLKHGRV